MPTLKEIIEEKLARIESVPDALVSEVEKYQKVLLKKALEEVSQFDYNPDGSIKLASKNYGKLEKLINTLRDTLADEKGGYYKAVISYIDDIAKQAALTNAYVAEEFSWKPKPIYEKILKSAQADTLSLLSGNAVEAKFLEPLKQQLAASVSTGASFKDTVKLLTDFIQGDEKEGQLLRHVKTVAYDAFARSDRGYAAAVFTAIDVQWYLYAGGLVKDSREFCKDRHGKYFHKNEIASWAKLEWQGKRAETNASTIFVDLGGYHCLHSLMAVSESSVPEADIQRAKENGYTD